MKKLFTSSGILGSCLVALAMMASQSARAEYVPLTALEGIDAWSGGGEGHASLVDENISTKWGCWFNPALEDANSWPTNPQESANKCYIIVKADKAVVPQYYFLVTANDTKNTEGEPDRNWLEWKIYGGNFASDADAARGADGWTLVDNHTTEDEPLPNDNYASKNYAFSEGVTTAFQYYWIEIISTVAQADVYQQMGEWGLGTYKEFETYLASKPKPDTGTDEPIILYVMEGTKMIGGESLPYLFDGDVTTKWGNGTTNRNEGETTNGAYFIVKASRAMAPTYYALTTANDTQQYSGRNWKQWQIYGLNAASDEQVTRSSEGWVAIDKKYNVGTDQLPAANYTQAFFLLSEENTTEYRYFKVEIDQIVNSGDYMQMAEFILGDQYTFPLDRANVAKKAEDSYDPNTFASKAVLDAMAAYIESIKACTEPAQLRELNAQLSEMLAVITASANSYAQLMTARNQVILAIEGGKLTDEAIEYLTAWISETEEVAPSAEYPCGNIAYIKANRQLSNDEAFDEVKRINAYLFNYSIDDDPAINPENAEGQIDKEFYTRINGSGGFGGEGDEMLYDGDRESTKWCTNSMPAWTIFKAKQEIKPTYYGLVTGGDTHSYPGRNWKTWKVYGGNFDADTLATRNSNAWVLLDDKANIGADILHTDNKFESYLYLSEGCNAKYKYFKIEVEAAVSGSLIQMNEFTFYNNANFKLFRQKFADNIANSFNPEGEPAFIDYINAYNAKFEELKATTYAPELMSLKNELTDLQNQIKTSADLYHKYDSLFNELQTLGIDTELLGEWFDGYCNENIAPNNKYIRGTYKNIIDFETNHCTLNNEDIQAEIDYLQWIYNAVDQSNAVQYILLGGHTEGQFGDGFYGHLIDGIDKDVYDPESPIDQTTGKPSKLLVKGTKWGGNASENGNTYIIFRTIEPTNPFFYTLTTGNDAATYTSRNWGTWYIYGANFEGDGDATKDAEGWDLIDAKEGMGQDRLHPVNEQPSYFGFSTETETKYTYYKVVVTKAYSGTQIQMNELHFGTPDEFQDIKTQYIADAQAFNTDVVAEQALIDEYEATIPDIDECQNMEALFRVNYALETLRDKITASAELYEKFANTVEANKTYLVDNEVSASDALSVFEEYLTANEEASDLYPNGTAAYILEGHVLPDSVMEAELEFMESLKVAAVALGYGKNADVSCLIVNRTFKNAGEMLKDEKEVNIGREAEGWNGYIYRTATSTKINEIFAAEFCNENAKFDVNQTIANLKNGFYKVTLNAGYRAKGELLDYTYAPLAYANETSTYVPLVREFAVDSLESWQGKTPDRKVYYESPDSSVYSWGIWGCEGAAHAFAQGRYAITLVAEVTDGTLTLGVKNEGTSGDEWTAVGNFQLWYLGENEADADAALAESQDYALGRVSVLLDCYEPLLPDDENYAEYPNFGEAQRTALLENANLVPFTYAALKTIGETMESIYTTKKAYAELADAAKKVYEKWVNSAVTSEWEDAYAAIDEGLNAGSYDDAEAALAAKAELYANFPDYLEVTGISKAYYDIKDDFFYDITTQSKNPYLQLGILYEPLEADEVILAFDYTSSQNPLEGGKITFLAPEWDPITEVQVPTLPMTSEKTTVYLNITSGIKAYKFGSATNHAVRWTIGNNIPDTSAAGFALQAGRFRVITKAQMKAEGGRAANVGDVNADNAVDIADAVSVLNAMAGEGDILGDEDVNGDGVVDIADFVTILNIMAGEEE